MNIRITGTSVSGTYNGLTQDVEGFSASSDHAGFNPALLSLRDGSTAYVRAKDAGTYRMNLTAGDFVYRDPNVQAVFQVTDGVLTISPAALEIETGSASKVYDGTPLTNSDVRVSGLVSGEQITVKAAGSQTGVGSSSNTCSIDWGSVRRENYTVRQRPGTLTVTAKGGYAATYGSGSVRRKGSGTPLEFIFKRNK